MLRYGLFTTNLSDLLFTICGLNRIIKMMLTNIFMNGNGYWISNAQNTEQNLDDQRKTIITQSTWLLSCKSSATPATNIKARIIENFRQKTSLTREDKGLLQMELIMNSHSWASDGCLWGNGRVTNFTKTSFICLYLMLLPSSPHSKCKPCPSPSIKGFRWECSRAPQISMSL